MPQGGYALQFADGTRVDCDLLVGADGASSRVRPLLTDARSFHIGVNAIELGIPDIDRTHPDLAAMVGRGNYWAIGPNQSLAAQRDGRVRVHLTFHTPEDWFATCGIPLADPPRARAALALAADPDDLAGAVRGYETAMFERTAAAAQESVDIMKVLTSPAGAQGVLEFFQHYEAPSA